MNTLIQFFGGAALAVAAVSANAELSYSPNAVFDPDSGLYWRLFETVEQGRGGRLYLGLGGSDEKSVSSLRAA